MQGPEEPIIDLQTCQKQIANKYESIQYILEKFLSTYNLEVFTNDLYTLISGKQYLVAYQNLIEFQIPLIEIGSVRLSRICSELCNQFTNAPNEQRIGEIFLQFISETKVFRMEVERQLDKSMPKEILSFYDNLKKKVEKNLNKEVLLVLEPKSPFCDSKEINVYYLYTEDKNLKDNTCSSYCMIF